MNIEEAKEVCDQGWPENQKMQRRFDYEQWLISEVERLTPPENLAGMYAVENPAYPQVKVGNFIICRQNEASVWIQREDAEGGQFSDDLLEKAISAFWKDNF